MGFYYIFSTWQQLLSILIDQQNKSNNNDHHHYHRWWIINWFFLWSYVVGFFCSFLGNKIPEYINWMNEMETKKKKQSDSSCIFFIIISNFPIKHIRVFLWLYYSRMSFHISFGCVKKQGTIKFSIKNLIRNKICWIIYTTIHDVDLVNFQMKIGQPWTKPLWTNSFNFFPFSLLRLIIVNKNRRRHTNTINYQPINQWKWAKKKRKLLVIKKNQTHLNLNQASFLFLIQTMNKESINLNEMKIKWHDSFLFFCMMVRFLVCHHHFTVANVNKTYLNIYFHFIC